MIDLTDLLKYCDICVSTEHSCGSFDDTISIVKAIYENLRHIFIWWITLRLGWNIRITVKDTELVKVWNALSLLINIKAISNSYIYVTSTWFKTFIELEVCQRIRNVNKRRFRKICMHRGLGFITHQNYLTSRIWKNIWNGYVRKYDSKLIIDNVKQNRFSWMG